MSALLRLRTRSVITMGFEARYPLKMHIVMRDLKIWRVLTVSKQIF
jgi:hypothetical protein